MNALRLIILTVVLFLAYEGLAYYPNGWFYPPAKDVGCFVTAQTARCGVVNNFGAPMYCQGFVYGQSRYGAYMQEQFAGVVYPGQNLWAYINAFNPYNDPIVAANASVQCRF